MRPKYRIASDTLHEFPYILPEVLAEELLPNQVEKVEHVLSAGQAFISGEEERYQQYLGRIAEKYIWGLRNVQPSGFVKIVFSPQADLIASEGVEHHVLHEAHEDRRHRDGSLADYREWMMALYFQPPHDWDSISEGEVVLQLVRGQHRSRVGVGKLSRLLLHLGFELCKESHPARPEFCQTEGPHAKIDSFLR